MIKGLTPPQAVCHRREPRSYEHLARGVLRLVLSDENFAVEVLHPYIIHRSAK